MTQEIKIQNVGGIRELQAHLEVGINVLTGRNGAGKSSALAALTKGFGGKVALEKRDGAPRGVVEVPGNTISLRSVARSTGEADLRLADVGPVSRAIDPGIEDPDRANFARLKALGEIRPMKVDEPLVRELAGDTEIAEEVVPEMREGALTDLIAVAERCRVVGHKLARDAEAEAARLEGAAGAAQQRLAEALERVGGEEALVETSGGAAEAALQALNARLAEARVRHEGRTKLEAHQAEIRASLGETPNPFRFAADLEARESAIAGHRRRIAEHEEEIARIRGQISKERELMAGVVADFQSFERMQQEEGTRLEKHRRSIAILETPVEGPTAEEVEQLEGEVEAAKQAHRTARLSDEVRSAQAIVAEATERVAAARKRGERLRDAAQTIGWRIGDVFAAQGLEGLTIVDGRLKVVDGDEVHDFATRRSEGQRALAILRVAAPAYAGSVMPLSRQIYTGLDSAARAELARLAQEHGIYVLTEEVADGELRIEQVAA